MSAHRDRLVLKGSVHVTRWTKDRDRFTRDLDILSFGAEDEATLKATIAEKLQAAVGLGNNNGRMKDYYDLWALPKAEDLDLGDLQTSIEKTFERRQTEVPTERPPRPMLAISVLQL